MTKKMLDFQCHNDFLMEFSVLFYEKFPISHGHSKAHNMCYVQIFPARIIIENDCVGPLFIAPRAQCEILIFCNLKFDTPKYQWNGIIMPHKNYDVIPFHCD